jgi:hypothetical protein
MSDSRQVLNALLPEGSLWIPKEDGDFDKLLDGMAENDDRIMTDLCCLDDIRNPHKTIYLSDLEREYGIQTDGNLTESVRRMQLAAVMFQGENNGSKDDLQNALNNAGFDVQVHENSPAVDPDIFLNSIPIMVAGGDNAYAGFYPTTPGDYTSVAGKTGGFLLVNGAVYNQQADYTSVANGSFMFAGNGDAVAGRYDKLRQDLIIYDIPDDPDSWPCFFFVGGDATRNGSGELTAIQTVDIPLTQRVVFERIILKYKPLHTWAGLIVNYI